MEPAYPGLKLVTGNCSQPIRPALASSPTSNLSAIPWPFTNSLADDLDLALKKHHWHKTAARRISVTGLC